MSSKTAAQDYANILSDLNVLEEYTWPIDPPVRFGEDSISRLCRRFRLPDTETVSSFRDFVDTHGRKQDVPIKRLRSTIALIPISSADCERGFSLMNLIISDRRNRLLITRVSSLMFIHSHGPEMNAFNPLPYVRTWLRQHRSANDTRVKTHHESPAAVDRVAMFLKEKNAK